jgi:hypothetical protein
VDDTINNPFEITVQYQSPEEEDQVQPPQQRWDDGDLEAVVIPPSCFSWLSWGNDAEEEEDDDPLGGAGGACGRYMFYYCVGFGFGVFFFFFFFARARVCLSVNSREKEKLSSRNGRLMI